MKISIRNFGLQFLLSGVLVAQLGISAARAADTTAPTLASSAPANGATAVALDSKIIFTFSEAMQTPTDYTTTLLWSDSNNSFDATKVSYSWSTDKTTLTCSYNGNLPSATTVSWTLLGGIMGVPGFGFSDLVGNGLTPMFVIGVFSTTGGGGGTNDCSGSGTNANVTVFNLNKSAMYLQNSAGAPTPDDSSTTDPFNFAAFVTLATGRTATSVTLALPGASPQPMDSFANFYFNFGSTNDLTKLNALYPAGTYTFAVTGTPNQTVTADLPANVPPNPPHVINYAAAQTINAGAAYTLSWDAFSGGLATDSILVDVYDSSHTMVFQITNSAGCPSVLPGTATSVVLPANTLASNQTYSAQITFLKNISLTTNASPPSVTIAGGSSMTDVTIATFTGGVTPPPEMVLTNAVWLPTGQFQFQFPSAPGTSYTVEYTSDLGNSLGWNPLTPTNATGNLIQITDTPPPGASPRIYRTRHN